jgi:hypothetical protein
MDSVELDDKVAADIETMKAAMHYVRTHCKSIDLPLMMDVVEDMLDGKMSPGDIAAVYSYRKALRHGR